MRTTLMLAASLAALAATASAQTKKAPAKPAAAPAAPANPGPRDWRMPNPDDVLVIDTNKGRIIVEMVPEVAPGHVERIRELAREHFYDGQTFFRVIDGFMDQTGDPENTGLGGSPKPDIQAEFLFRRSADTAGWIPVSDQVTLEHGMIKSMGVASQSMSLAPMTSDGKVRAWGLYCAGTAGMARAEDPNSANSQFFLMRDRFPRLEQKYTAWGRVILGQDVVKAIKTGEPVPEPQDKMERVRLLSDIPEKDRPKVRVIDPAGPWFKAQVAKLRTEKGTVADACDLPVPVEVK